MRPISSRILVCLLAAAALSMVGAACGRADEYPERPIKFVVGFGAGGPTDIFARVLANQLSIGLGKKFIVENKPGASGNIATQAVVTAAPDGYTFLIGASPVAVNQTLFPDFPVKFGRDLVAIAPLGTTDNVLVVQPSLGVHDLDGFIRLVRKHPNSITYATLGVGSFSHLAGLAFDMRAGTKMLPVAYRGGAEAATDLLGGHVQARFASIPAVLDHIRAGQLLAIASTGLRRTSWLPDVPTISESGFPGFDVSLWVGVFGPAGIDEGRIRLIGKAIAEAMASRAMQRALDGQGIAPLPMSRTDFNRFVASEIDRWKTVVEALKN
jgi:tripartite-type tricarboxylate transporter receptor subunit TctC